MHDIITLQQQARGYLKYAKIFQTQAEIQKNLKHIADIISEQYNDKFPLFLNILGHGAFLTTHLLSYITCEAQLDTIQIAPIDAQTGQHLRIIPSINITKRDIIVLDEMLDDGKTMQIITKSLLNWGANSVNSAVLCNKDNDNKLMQPTYAAMSAPKNIYLFGCGMSVYGFWSHLSDIWLLNSQ